MSDRPIWVIAAAPAALIGVLYGGWLLGQDLRCAGELDAILDGETGRGAIARILAHALSRPLGLLVLAAPVALGLWAVLVAAARLRERPQANMALTLGPIIALTASTFALSGQVCDPGPGGLIIALLAGGLLAALAGGILAQTRVRA